MICLHCKEKEANKPRGLCFVCYTDRSIRRLYASKTKRGLGAETVIRCDACGTLANPMLMKKRGWKSRRVPGFAVQDVYCPDCFRQWGWGDALTRKVGITIIDRRTAYEQG